MLSPLGALLQGPVLFLELGVGKSIQGRERLGCQRWTPPASGGTDRRERVTLWAPGPENLWVCGQGWAGEGGGHPASLSLAQLHFQKFFPPVRRGKKCLGSLLGCQEGDDQVRTRFPRALKGQAGALGPPTWAKGPAQPWDRSWVPARGVRRTDPWNWGSPRACPLGCVCCCKTETGRRKA